jgi:hypothetical protein
MLVGEDDTILYIADAAGSRTSIRMDMEKSVHEKERELVLYHHKRVYSLSILLLDGFCCSRAILLVVKLD